MVKKLLQTCKKWISHVSFGFADQAVLSGGNFFLNVLLVRWLIPSEYGIFAIAFSIFLIFSSFQNALILQPVSVIGATYYQNNLSKYLSAATFINGILTLGFAVLLILVALIMAFFNRGLALSFLGLGVATPFILFFWLFRQICYVKTRPDLAWRASLLYAFFLLGSIFVLHSNGFISVFSAFMVMAFSNLFAVLFFWRYLEVDSILVCVQEDLIFIKNIWTEHWNYGRWIIGSAFANWFSTLSYLPLVGILIGTQQAGAFRAMQNLILPLERLASVFALLLIPWISKNRLPRGDVYVKKRLLILMGINALLASTYGLLLIIYGDRLTKLLYGDGYVTSFTWMIPYFVAIAIAGSLIQILWIGLKIVERPYAIFLAEIIGTVVTLTIGLYLVITFKVLGSVLALLVSTVFMLIALAYFLSKYFRENKPLNATAGKN